MKSRVRRSERTFVSLFCGCGGFDAGFIETGYRCIGAFDISRSAVEHHRSNLLSDAKICDLSLEWPFHRALDVDVVLAGTPCQGFSTAGNRHFNDPRNKLLLVAGRIATKIRPRVFLAENVTGVIAGTHKRYWQTLHRIVRLAGYRSVDIDCIGTEMGVPQIRHRKLMLAWNTGADIQIEIPMRDGGTLRSALENINGAANHEIHLLPHDLPIGIIVRHIKPGQKLCNVRAGPRSVHTWEIPSVFGATSAKERRILQGLLRLRRRMRSRETGDADPVCAAALSRELSEPVAGSLCSLVKKGFVRKIDGRYDLTHSFNGKFRRLEWGQPSYTVDTRFGDARYFIHPEEHRGFTVREAARIQGFPDSFVFSGAQSTQFRLIGNAVPPPISRVLARFVAERVL